MALTEEQTAFRSVVRDFAAAEIAPHAEAWDRDHVFPTDTVHRMGDPGLFGLVFDEEYGGADADFTTLCIAIEEIGRVDHCRGGIGTGPSPSAMAAAIVATNRSARPACALRSPRCWVRRGLRSRRSRRERATLVAGP